MLCIRVSSSLSWFSRRWRGGCFLFWSNGFALRAGQRQAGFFFKLVRAPVRGDSFLFWSNGFALRAGQRQGGVFRIPPPYLWTPLSPQRVKGYSPLTIPKKKSKPKNASRFAKRIFLCVSHLRLRRGCYVLAGLHVQQGCKVCCEAANRRRLKMRLRDLRANARISSILSWSPPLRGY